MTDEVLNYSSVNSAMSEDEAIHFLVEFLTSLEVSGDIPLPEGWYTHYHLVLTESTTLPMVHAALLPDNPKMLCRLTSCMAHQRRKQLYSLGYLFFHLTHHYLSASNECLFNHEFNEQH